MSSDISQAELKKVRDWAKARLADSDQQPWSAFLLHRLTETMDALLNGLAANRSDAALLGVTCHNAPRLVVSNVNRDAAGTPADSSALAEEEASVCTLRRPVREPAV